MGRPRKGDSRYYLGENVLGKPAWLLRDKAALPTSGVATVANLLEVSDGGTTDADGEVELPKPDQLLRDRLRLDRDWSGLDLSGFDLREVMSEYPPARLDGTNFTGSDLRGVPLSGVDGICVNFTGAQTEGMHLDEGVVLRDIITDGTFDMNGVVLGKSDIRFAEQTRLIGVNKLISSTDGGWGTSAAITNVDFSGETFGVWGLSAFSKITDGNFTGSKFVGEKYSVGTTMRFGVMGTTFTYCDFTDADMPDVRAGFSVFQSCRFRNADISGWTFEGENTFHGCDFTDANLSNWSISNSHWGRISFKGQNTINNVDLHGAEGRVLSSIIESGYGFTSYTVAEAAKKVGKEPEDFGLLVWMGEVEGRDARTLDIVDGRVDSDTLIPEWALKQFA